jgi:CheY-like chemotaxis protein
MYGVQRVWTIVQRRQTDLPAVSPSPLRIAHIDDDPDLRAMVRLALRVTGPYPLISCESGEVAQRLVPSFEPDVLLVDLMMPGMDGVQTVEALARSMDLSAVSIVFSSGASDAGQMQRFFAAGADAVLPKPFDALRLAEQLNRIHNA